MSRWFYRHSQLDLEVSMVVTITHALSIEAQRRRQDATVSSAAARGLTRRSATARGDKPVLTAVYCRGDMCAEAAEAEKGPSEANKRRATWAGLLLEGQDELRATLGVDETGFLRVAGPSHADRRGYFMYAVLDELQKAGACLFRWLKLLEEMEAPDAEADRFWTESIAEEESLRIRKLVEALTDLICFRRTNEDDYYRHLLLLRDLDAARGTQQDLRLFYAVPA
jgi:hypothetical protein